MNTRTASPADIQPLFLTDEQIAPLIGLSASFLRKDRRTKRVIPFVRFGAKSRVLYDLDSVRAALLARQVGGESNQKRPHSASSSRSQS
jgi:hypothetical protein